MPVRLHDRAIAQQVARCTAAPRTSCHLFWLEVELDLICITTEFVKRKASFF